MNPEAVIRIIRARPFVLSDEKRVQADIGLALDEAGIAYEREVALSGRDIVDFMFPEGIAMEIKLSMAKRAIYRQCERYCEHSSVKGLILVSATAMGFPEEIKGKPCWVASLGAGWL